MLKNIEYYTYITELQNLPSERQQSSCKSANSPEKKNRILLITSQPNQWGIKTERDKQHNRPAINTFRSYTYQSCYTLKHSLRQ
jgi:hypothetical protein